MESHSSLSNGGEQQYPAAAVDGHLPPNNMPASHSNNYNPYFSEEFPAANDILDVPVPVYDWWPNLLEYSPAVDNIQSDNGGNQNPMPHQLQRPPVNKQNRMDYQTEQMNINNESNGNIQFEYGGNPNLAMNELNYYNPSIQEESNNNIQQFEFGGNPNPIPYQVQLPAVNEQNLMGVDGCGVDRQLNTFSGCRKDSPIVININNIQIGGRIPSSSNPSDFNGETATRSNIPVGYKFNPTDKELIVHFLGREVSRSGNYTTPEIKHANIYEYEPDQLEELVHYHKYTNEKMYFYTPIKKIGESKTNRVVKSGKGYWRATQAPTPIRNEKGHTIGMKTPLTYMIYREKNRPKGDKTPWLMCEYKLPRSQKSRQELVLAVMYYHKAKKSESKNILLRNDMMAYGGVLT